MKVELIEVDGKKFYLKINYETRSDSTVSIRRDKINIRIPIALNREEQFKELLKLKNWARDKIKETPERFQEKPKREYLHGEILKVGAEEYKLNIELKEKQSSSARIENNNIYLLISSMLAKEKQSKHVSTLLSRVITAKRLSKLKEKLNLLNELHFQQKINKIFFKNNKSKCGSCSSEGNINISTRLLFAPDDVLEYICIHELAHLIEQNHSESFWNLVEKAMPNYTEKEAWLKEHGKECIF